MVQKKKKSAYTSAQVVVILDRSGSMQSIANDAIGGFNAFVAEQKKSGVPTKLTLIQFDDKYEVVYKSKDIKDVDNLNDVSFQPRGSTALLDAVGKTITTIKEEHLYTPEEKHVFVIITDGYENASREWNPSGIKKLIEECRDVPLKWEFTFIGSNQDAILTGVSYGIPAASSLTFANTSAGVNNMMRSMSNNISGYVREEKTCVSYSAEDRIGALAGGGATEAGKGIRVTGATASEILEQIKLKTGGTNATNQKR